VRFIAAEHINYSCTQLNEGTKMEILVFMENPSKDQPANEKLSHQTNREFVINFDCTRDYLINAPFFLSLVYSSAEYFKRTLSYRET